MNRAQPFYCFRVWWHRAAYRWMARHKCGSKPDTHKAIKAFARQLHLSLGQPIHSEDQIQIARNSLGVYDVQIEGRDARAERSASGH